MVRILILLTVAAVPVFGQKIEVVKLDRVQRLLTERSDKIQVINFWTTWCGPCVKELPYFQNIEAKNNPDIKITLINLDFADQLKKVESFVNRRKITSTVILLDEVDYNAWIDKVDPSWNGAIPATLFINTQTGERKFIDKPLKEADIEATIDSLKP